MACNRLNYSHDSTVWRHYSQMAFWMLCSEYTGCLQAWQLKRTFFSTGQRVHLFLSLPSAWFPLWTVGARSSPISIMAIRDGDCKVEDVAVGRSIGGMISSIHNCWRNIGRCRVSSDDFNSEQFITHSRNTVTAVTSTQFPNNTRDCRLTFSLAVAALYLFYYICPFPCLYSYFCL